VSGCPPEDRSISRAQLYIGLRQPKLPLANKSDGQITAAVERYVSFRPEHFLFEADNLTTLCFSLGILSFSVEHVRKIAAQGKHIRVFSSNDFCFKLNHVTIFSFCSLILTIGLQGRREILAIIERVGMLGPYTFSLSLMWERFRLCNFPSQQNGGQAVAGRDRARILGPQHAIEGIIPR
jgi:hypothetical protein